MISTKEKRNTYPPLFIRSVYNEVGGPGFLFPQATGQVAMLAWIFGDCREARDSWNSFTLRVGCQSSCATIFRIS